MWMWKWIMKILGLGKPSEEELAKKLHEIALDTFEGYSSISSILKENGWVFLEKGDPGYEEAKKLLAGYWARGFQVQNMFIRCAFPHEIRKPYRLGWVADGREQIWVTLFRLHPKGF